MLSCWQGLSCGPPALPLMPHADPAWPRAINFICCLHRRFVAKAEQEVKAAVSGIRSQLTADQASLEGSLEAMESDADGSLATLAANEGAATTAAAAAQAALRAGGERLGAALAASVARGGELQGAAASAAAEAAAKLEAHSSALSAAVASQTAALATLASEQAAACSGAVSAAGNARAELQEATAAGLAADSTAGDRLDELTQAGAAAVAAFAGEQAAELAQLSGLVQQRINEEYLSDANRGEMSGVGCGRSVLVGNTAALVQLTPAHELHPCTSFQQLGWLADVWLPCAVAGPSPLRRQGADRAGAASACCRRDPGAAGTACGCCVCRVPRTAGASSR